MKMNKKEKVKYWVDIANYDFDTADVMLKSKRYLYVVFMCQQAIEKIIKAIYIEQLDLEPPRSHNLYYILKKTNIIIDEETITFLNLLSAHYIRNRYPDYKEKLSQKLNKQKAKEFFNKTEEIFNWLKSQIISVNN